MFVHAFIFQKSLSEFVSPENPPFFMSSLWKWIWNAFMEQEAAKSFGFFLQFIHKQIPRTKDLSILLQPLSSCLTNKQYSVLPYTPQFRFGFHNTLNNLLFSVPSFLLVRNNESIII